MAVDQLRQSEISQCNLPIATLERAGEFDLFLLAEGQPFQRLIEHRTANAQRSHYLSETAGVHTGFGQSLGERPPTPARQLRGEGEFDKSGNATVAGMVQTLAAEEREQRTLSCWSFMTETSFAPPTMRLHSSLR